MRRYKSSWIAVGAIAILVSLLSPSLAGAHVEIQPEAAPRGSLSVLGIVVPNESQTASTIRLELELPTTRPIVAVAVQPIPGWQVTVEKQTVTKNGQAVEAVSRIIWTAGSFGPGQFQQFFIRAALPDKGKRLTFKALQTYSDGEVVRWIETETPGAPDPEYPAPVLTLTSGKGH